MSPTHRITAVAGQFYPNEPAVLQTDINQYLNEVSTLSDSVNPELKAIIVPHAGYIYSGAIAASAYNLLYKQSSTISNIILLGPAHRLSFQGIASSSVHYFDTPLGSVAVNLSLIDKIKHFSFINCIDAAHQNEHCLEVQLPFLQTVLKKFTIVPLLIGECDPNDVATILDFLWGGNETLIIISSDLSHFNNYELAKHNDNNTSQAILNLQPENIHYEDACGRTPVNGLLKIAQKKRLKVSILDVRNSGDTAGDKQRVVGYGAYSFT
ncbi:MAG: AmmeMemoRadiSam system protein B [Thiohalomonadales bacterium]